MIKYLLVLLSLIIMGACSDNEITSPSIENFETDSLGIQGNAWYYRIPDDSSRYIIYSVAVITNFYDSKVIEGVVPVLYVYLIEDTFKIVKSESYRGILTDDVPLLKYVSDPEDEYGKVYNIQPDTRTFCYVNTDTLKYVDFPIFQVGYALGLEFSGGLSKRVQEWEYVTEIKELSNKIDRWELLLQKGLIDKEEFDSLIQSGKRVEEMRKLWNN